MDHKWSINGPYMIYIARSVRLSYYAPGARMKVVSMAPSNSQFVTQGRSCFLRVEGIDVLTSWVVSEAKGLARAKQKVESMIGFK